MARPRSVRAHEQVLEAALRLFAERGIDTTSMDAIAEVSGVSKATIYKHWRDKDSLCLEAMLRAHGLDEKPPESKNDDIRAALVAVLSYKPQVQDAERQTRLMPHFMAYSARNPAFGVAWRSRVMEPQQKQLRRLLKEGVKRGLITGDLDIDLSVALLIGPMLYAYFLGMANQKPVPDLPERVVDTFWKAYADDKSARRHNRSKRRS